MRYALFLFLLLKICPCLCQPASGDVLPGLAQHDPVLSGPALPGPGLSSMPFSLSSPSSSLSFFLRGNASGWQMQKAGELNADGRLISARGYKTKAWLKAVVPGTVLTSLVADKIYPDPYYGDLNRRKNHIIPDMADSGREFYHYWYRTAFRIPRAFAGRRIWLKPHGINYRAAIWLNGKKVGDMAGMFNAQSFDVTDIIHPGGKNILAFDILPLDVPGQSGLKKRRRIGARGENNNGGDGLIGENVTMLMSAGWDFTYPDGIRDRNTGIWRDVELFATGNVVLKDPFVVSTLPLPDTSSSRETISVEVQNPTGQPQQGILEAVIKETGLTIKKEVSLAPGEKKTIVLAPDEYPRLKMTHPGLWWPVNKGEQNLYTLDLAFIQDNKISQRISTRFGIREISSDQHTPDSSRRFLVNGRPVFIRGTNWIPEAMLRNSPKRTRAELLYTRQAGVNLLRLWGGGIAESDYFFQLCDELGILVWSEFWLTGDTRPPDDTKLYLDNLENTVKRIRTHASLAYYVASNEAKEVPGEGALIRSLDSSRGYQPQSECCGVHDGSPYKYENPMQYFQNTASQRGSRIYGFNPEYGTICLPTVESLREMMPKQDLWPINDSVWNYLDGGGFHQVTTKYKLAVDQFGPSSSIDEFAKKAQFVGALNYRAIWEVWNYNKFSYGDRFASGFLFWYHNSPVRQVAGRMYDWSLEPTAALYYSQNALQPLHPQFDYLKNTISVYNDYRMAFKNYQLSATVYNIRSEKVFARQTTVDIPADGVVNDALTLEFPADISQVHFIKLILRDASGKFVSDAFYWRSKDAYQGPWTLTGPAVSGFQQINGLPKVKLDVRASLQGDSLISVSVANPSASLSFFTQLKLQDAQGASVRPAFYTDNFFCLLPGESRRIIIRFSKEDVPGRTLHLVTEGWNASPQKMSWQLK